MTTNEELAQDRTDLAALRTAMAADRSLMAWIRTGLSMIGFGFTIYKFLQGFAGSDAARGMHEQSPRTIGLLLTALGTFAVVIGTIEYWGTLRSLSRHQHFSPRRPTFFIALIMSVGGVFIFFSILTRLL